jgi:deoxyribonuclease V
MIIAAFDVHYLENGRASAAAVLFHDYRDPELAAEYTLSLPSAADYIPGQFYRRELPCILALIEQFEENPHEMMVDGYVTLGDRPGLGLHLFESFQGKIPVIGVAKSPFRRSAAIPVLRGRSRAASSAQLAQACRSPVQKEGLRPWLMWLVLKTSIPAFPSPKRVMRPVSLRFRLST